MLWIPAVGFKVFTKIKYEIIDGTGSGIDIIPPNGLQYFFPRHHLVLIFNKEFEKHGFLFTQLDFFAFYRQGFLGSEIYGMSAETITVADRRSFLQLFVFADQLLYP